MNAGQTVTYECQDEPEKTKVEILIRKQDAETGKGQAQAGLSLAGAEFHVAFFDSIFDNQNEIGVKVPLRSWKLKSDADGVVRMDEAHLISGDSFFENNELPLGTITVWEMHAPEGYLVDTVTHCIRTGTEQNGSYKALKIWNPVEIKEKLIRGDLKLVKAADKTLKRLADIPFRITSQATGESHVIRTDKNGEASTGAYWNPHTVNTNEGKTSEDGIWFGEIFPQLLCYDLVTEIAKEDFLMNTLFTSRLNGIFILNTLLELHKPVTVSELAGIINHRYDHVTAPRKMVSADTVKRFLNDFYQTTSGTDYCSIRLFCFKKNRYGSLVPDHDLENVTLATYVAACLELNPSMNVRDGRGLKSNSVVHFHTA